MKNYFPGNLYISFNVNCTESKPDVLCPLLLISHEILQVKNYN